MSLPVEVVFTT